MKEKLINSETAILARSVGFSDHSKSPDNIPSHITQSLLQKWIREKHDIHIEIRVWNDNTWSAQLVSDTYFKEDDDSYEAWGCSSYEEALEIGLVEALSIIDNHDL
jgi:hypothetical protein